MKLVLLGGIFHVEGKSKAVPYKTIDRITFLLIIVYYYN